MDFFFPPESFYKVPFLVCWAILNIVVTPVKLVLRPVINLVLNPVFKVVFHIILPIAMALFIIFLFITLVCGLSGSIFGWPDMSEKPTRNNTEKATDREAEVHEELHQQKESGVDIDLIEAKRIIRALESLLATMTAIKARIEQLESQEAVEEGFVFTRGKA